MLPISSPNYPSDIEPNRRIHCHGMYILTELQINSVASPLKNCEKDIYTVLLFYSE